jgi:hypothetical protein
MRGEMLSIQVTAFRGSDGGGLPLRERCSVTGIYEVRIACQLPLGPMSRNPDSGCVREYFHVEAVAFLNRRLGQRGCAMHCGNFHDGALHSTLGVVDPRKRLSKNAISTPCRAQLSVSAVNPGTRRWLLPSGSSA